jgi:hypothetical protein
MPDNRPIEYERWKEDIDLRRYAARCGYMENERKSGNGYYVFHKGEDPSTRDTLVIRRGTKFWVFFDSAGNHGTILDLAAAHLRVSLKTREGWAAVCKELREEAGGRPEPTTKTYTAPPRSSGPRRDLVRRCYDAASSPTSCAYLNRRGIRDETLTSDRLRDTWRLRSNGEILFPHLDAEGLCGFERKAPGVSAFSKGGVRGLWCSHTLPDDDCLVVAESALDAISYLQLKPNARARLVSTGGTPSRSQVELLSSCVARLPTGGALIIATDNDFDKPPERNAGRILAARIKEMALETRADIQIETPIPPRGKDWNDVLQYEERDFIHSLDRDVSPHL